MEYYIYVFYYPTTEIIEIKVSRHDERNVEQIIQDNNLDVNDCNYMVSNEKLNIKTLK